MKNCVQQSDNKPLSLDVYKRQIHGFLDIFQPLGILLKVVFVLEPPQPEVQRVAHAVQQCLCLLYTSTLGNILSRCNTAGMEGTHGQLGTGLADGLCCDDTDGLAQLDGLTRCV